MSCGFLKLTCYWLLQLSVVRPMFMKDHLQRLVEIFNIMYIKSWQVVFVGVHSHMSDMIAPSHSA